MSGLIWCVTHPREVGGLKGWLRWLGWEVDRG